MNIKKHQFLCYGCQKVKSVYYGAYWRVDNRTRIMICVECSGNEGIPVSKSVLFAMTEQTEQEFYAVKDFLFENKVKQ